MRPAAVYGAPCRSGGISSWRSLHRSARRAHLNASNHPRIPALSKVILRVSTVCRSVQRPRRKVRNCGFRVAPHSRPTLVRLVTSERARDPTPHSRRPRSAQQSYTAPQWMVCLSSFPGRHCRWYTTPRWRIKLWAAVSIRLHFGSTPSQSFWVPFPHAFS